MSGCEMKHLLRYGLWLVLAIACVLFLFHPVTAQPSPTPTPTPLSALRLDPQRLKATLDRGDVAAAVQQLEVGWQQQLEEYFQWSLRSDSLPPAQIAQSLTRIARLTGKRSALVYAIAIPDQLEVILLLPNGQLIHNRVTAAPPPVLTEVSRRFRTGLVNVNTSSSEYLPAAQQLYQWLIEPLKSALERQRIDHLIFCLGRDLRSVPMAALHDGQRFLIEQYSISIIPAFNLLDRNPARLQRARLLAMGSSQFETQEPLPAVPLELSAIAQLWQGEILLNEKFTLEQFRQERSRYPFAMVHLATHATFAPGEVQNSFIQFWDRPLRLDQFWEMNLRRPIVQLLVLSACRTALGDASAELGFAGLAVQSGAKAALASLWSISDAATAVVMVDFYENLKTAPTKINALRRTQLGMLHHRLHFETPSVQRAFRNFQIPENVAKLEDINLSHPYYWAGFTMIGNPW